jgi:hypothetical protein
MNDYGQRVSLKTAGIGFFENLVIENPKRLWFQVDLEKVKLNGRL